MDDEARAKAEWVAGFYHTSEDIGTSGLGLAEHDDSTWGAAVVRLGGADRAWLLSLHDAVRDLAGAVWPPNVPADVVTGRPVLTSEAEAEVEARAADVARFWAGGRWDEVERGVGDTGSPREWFQALADAVRELAVALGRGSG